MVSADALNLDVLEQIFAYLAGNDLPAVALASRAFFAGVIPRLYSTLLFRLSQAKRYPAVMSPFAAVSAHPELAVHVRHVDIRILPTVKNQYNSKFLTECTRALDLCHNLTSFRCSVNALPPFIGVLQKKDRLRDLRIYANLTTEQCQKLVKGSSEIRHLTLDFASWNVMNLLPQWTGALKNSLTTLTLFMANELNETVLGSALEELPNLSGLHVVGCAKVDHHSILTLVKHTPNLTALSMTTGDTSRALPQPRPSLARLQHLAIGVRLQSSPPVIGAAPSTGVGVLSSILNYIASPSPSPSFSPSFSSSPPSLVSFIVKYPDRQNPLTIAPSFIQQQLIGTHARTLRTIALIDCLGSMDVLTALCRACVALERLEVMIPVRDWKLFTAALSESRTLRALVDANALNTHHPRAGPSLTQDNIRDMFRAVPSLQKVVGGDKRVWTRRKDQHGNLAVGMDRRPTQHAAAIHWFMPRD